MLILTLDQGQQQKNHIKHYAEIVKAEEQQSALTHIEANDHRTLGPQW